MKHPQTFNATMSAVLIVCVRVFPYLLCVGVVAIVFMAAIFG